MPTVVWIGARRGCASKHGPGQAASRPLGRADAQTWQPEAVRDGEVRKWGGGGATLAWALAGMPRRKLAGRSGAGAGGNIHNATWSGHQAPGTPRQAELLAYLERKTGSVWSIYRSPSAEWRNRISEPRFVEEVRANEIHRPKRMNKEADLCPFPSGENRMKEAIARALQ